MGCFCEIPVFIGRIMVIKVDILGVGRVLVPFGPFVSVIARAGKVFLCNCGGGAFLFLTWL